MIRKGNVGSIISMGSAIHNVVEAWEILSNEGIKTNVYNYPCPTVIDEVVLRNAVESGFILVVEDHNSSSGLACTISRGLVELGITCPFGKLGVSNYAPSGTPSELYRLYNLHPEGIVEATKTLMKLRIK